MRKPDGISRRNLLKESSLLGAAASAFSLLGARAARGAGNDRLKAGLVGCGGRGTQAVVDLLTGNEHVELVAAADVFEDHLEQSLGRMRDPKFIGRYAGIVVERDGKPKEMKAEDLVASIQPRIKIEPDRHFVGFDAYQKLLASAAA